MQRTLLVSNPDPASCGRSNVLGPHCACVAFRFLVMELSVLLLTRSVFHCEGLCRSFVTALPRQPNGPDVVATLYLERFPAQAVEQSGCLQPPSTRWLCQFHGISGAPVSSVAAYPASAFDQTVSSPRPLVSSLFRNHIVAFAGSFSALPEKALHLPTHHQLRSNQLLLNLRCPWRHEALEVPCSQDRPGWYPRHLLTVNRAPLPPMRSEVEPM